MVDYKDIVVKDDDNRLVEGWASVEVLDRQGDIVPIEAVKTAFVNYMINGGNIMKEHQNKPVGRVIQWEVAKNEIGVEGVKMIVEINKNNTVADDTWREIKAGLLNGFSIAGRKLDSEVKMDNGGNQIQVLKALDLNEISIVREPANQYALLEHVSIAKGMKTMDIEVTKEMEHEVFFKFLKASYPWDKCLEDNKEKYGEEGAKKICGSIREKYGKSMDDEWNESDANANKSEEEDEAEKALKFILFNKYYDPIRKGYMWDKCIADQMDRYHDMADAERVCGAIRQKIMRERGYSYTDHNSEHKSMDSEEEEKANYDATDTREEAEVKRIANTGIKGSGEEHNPIHKNSDSVNKADKITSNMAVNKVKKSDTQIETVEDKDMNTAFHTESDGLEEKKKGALSTKIEEEEHGEKAFEHGEPEERSESGSEEFEGREESNGVEERLERIERLLSEVLGQRDKVSSEEAALGDAHKANYQDQSKDVSSKEPKSEVDGRRKGGVGIEQVPDGGANSVRKSAQKPSGVVGFGRDYTAGKVSNDTAIDPDEIFKSVLSGKQTAKGIYAKTHGRN